MTWALTSPVTGAAETGLTSPTYTLTTDTAPTSLGKQSAITALGGTQTGVVAHTVAQPFTITMTRPAVLRTLANPNPVTGVISSIPRNVYTILTRKGVLPLTGQPLTQMLIRTTVEVPAGADLADPANVRAALSLHIGALYQQSAGIGDTTVTGIT